MNIVAKEKLMQAIAATVGGHLGIAFRQLGRDLENSSKPIRLSYADLAALE